MKHETAITALALTFLLLASTAQADTSPPAAEIVATGEVSGTTLVVTPQIPFASATLRVAGPSGYEAIAWSEGGPLALDLLAQGWINGNDGLPAGRPVLLPDGRYGYEVVFHLADGGRRGHDAVFHVENGVVRPSPAGRGRASSSVADSAEVGSGDGVGGPESTLGTTDDAFAAVDAANDGATHLEVHAHHINRWGFRNQSGDARLSTSGGVSWTDFVTVKPDGDFGLGTTQPQAALHIFRPNAFIRLASSSPCPNPNATWLMGPASGRLDFSVGNGCVGDLTGTKMSIRGDGSVGIGTTAPAAKLHLAGSGIIEGDVSLGSSRTIKHEIEPLDSAAVLASVRSLPLYRWKYRADPAQAPHVGPMAEVMHATFAVGRDERQLSPADSAGLALAAVRGVDARVDRLREQNERLAAENHALAARLAALEALARAAGGADPD